MQPWGQGSEAGPRAHPARPHPHPPPVCLAPLCPQHVPPDLRRPGRCLLPGGHQQTRAQHGQRARLVLHLAPLGLAAHDDARRDVAHAHGGLHLVVGWGCRHGVWGWRAAAARRLGPDPQGSPGTAMTPHRPPPPEPQPRPQPCPDPRPRPPQPNFELIRHDVVEKILLEVDQIYHLACPASPVHYKSVVGRARPVCHPLLAQPRAIALSHSPPGLPFRPPLAAPACAPRPRPATPAPRRPAGTTRSRPSRRRSWAP